MNKDVMLTFASIVSKVANKEVKVQYTHDDVVGWFEINFPQPWGVNIRIGNYKLRYILSIEVLENGLEVLGYNMVFITADGKRHTYLHDHSNYIGFREEMRPSDELIKKGNQADEENVNKLF